MKRRAIEGMRAFLGRPDLVVQECHMLSIVAERLDEPSLIESFLQRWRERVPEDVTPLHRLLQLARSRERHAEAYALASEILERVPDDPSALEARAMTVRAAAELAVDLEGR